MVDTDMWYGFDDDSYGDTPAVNQDPTGLYGDTSGADVYDAGGNDYWSPMYEPAGGAATKAAVEPGRWTPGIQPTQPAASRSPSSGSSASRYYPTSKSSTSMTESIMPSGPAPSVDLPDFNAPEWDEGKIAELSRKAAGPFVGGLRRGLNRALVSIRSSEKNPVARAQMYRQAMEGFGGEQGLGGVLAASRRQGRAEYGQEYNYEYQEAVQKTNQLNLEAQANFNAAMLIYQSKTKQQTTSTSKTSYSTTPSSSGGSAGESGEETIGTRSLPSGMAYGGETMANFINPSTRKRIGG